MKPLNFAVLSLICAGCASAPEAPVREYLDEQTTATITVVSEPWIFSRERTNARIDERDYLNIYAIDVNRMGDHRQYLAVLQTSPLVNAAGEELQPPALNLRVGGEVVSLQPSSADARTLGVAQPLAESYTYAARWWYYPVDKDTLARIAEADDLQASLAAGDTRAAYVLWRDGSAEAAALSAAIP